MLFCMYCGEVYNKDNVVFDKYNEWNQCPKTNCDGYIVDIDEEILPQIILLNNKGYRTQYCCQGHMNDSVVRLYILFECEYSFGTLPKGFITEENTTDNRTCISFSPKGKSDKQKYKKLLKARTDLYDWVNKLEDNNY